MSAAAAGAGSGNEPKVENKKETGTKAVVPPSTMFNCNPKPNSNNNTNNNNNNNNNNNVEETEEDKERPNLNTDVLQPAIRAQARGSDYYTYVYNLKRFLYETKMFPLSKVHNFLKDFILAVWAIDGNYDVRLIKNISQNFGRREITNETNRKFCTFLGTRQGAYTDGCKLNTLPSKLYCATKLLFDTLYHFLKYKVTNEVRNEITKNNEVMFLLMIAIRNVFYFFGQNQLKPPFVAAPELFDSFIEKMNALFEKPILRVTCEDKKQYGCGRFLAMGQCNTEKYYYIFIYSTNSEANQNVSVNAVGEILHKEGAKCGGRRRTRSKGRHKVKKLKSRKH